MIGVITNDSSDSTKWGPATRWSLSGNLEFTLEFITNETSQKVVGFTEFKQQHQVKILQNEGDILGAVAIAKDVIAHKKNNNS